MRVHNKLVRDRIPAIIRKDGHTPITKQLDGAAYRIALEQKLHEEVAEFLADRNGEELADILEVVYALGETLHITPHELEIIRKKKVVERGAFQERTYLLYVDERSTV